MIKFFSYLMFSLSLLLMVTSCEDNEASQSEIDEMLINNYWSAHKNDAAYNGKELKALSNGVYYVLRKAGNAATTDRPVVDEANFLFSTVTVDYSGKLLTGTEFDSNDSTEINLGNVVKGWQVGLPQMRCYDEATLFIPSAAGYGDSKKSDIPANSVLIFDIKLLRFETYHN